MKALVSKLETIPMSMSTLQRAAPLHTRVLLYDKLPATREALFGRKQCAIVLYQMHDRSGRLVNKIGHYALVMKTPGSKKLRYFSSFGLRAEEEIHIMHSKGKLLKLLGDHDYNRVSVQNTRNTNTCGLHALIRAYFWKLKNAEYLRLIKRYEARTPDDVVSIMALPMVLREFKLA